MIVCVFSLLRKPQCDGHPYNVMVTSYNVMVTSYNVMVTPYNVMVTSYNVMVTPYNVMVTSYNDANQLQGLKVTSSCNTYEP